MKVTNILQQVKSIKLITGFDLPQLGFGTYRCNGKPLEKALKYAIQVGYRHIDTAWLYQNEDTIGKVFKEVLKESNGELKRENFFITSKVWNTHHSKKMVRKCLNESLTNLKLDYLDMYLMHYPLSFKENTGDEPFPKDSKGKPLYSDVSYIETYKAMEELLKEGKMKSIGLSNFTISQMEDILKNCEIKPSNLQMEISPYLQNDEIVEFCKKHQIIITAYGVIGAGEKSTITNMPFLLDNKTLIEIGKKYNKSSAQVCLRWGIQRGLVVLAKSVTPNRILENYQVFDFELTNEDMNLIKELHCNMRSLRGFDIFADHKHYPFHH